MDTNTPMTIDNGGPAEPPDNGVATAPDDWNWDDVADTLSEMPAGGLHLLAMTAHLQTYGKDFEDGAADPEFAAFLSSTMSQCGDADKALINRVASGQIHTDEAARLGQMVQAEIKRRDGSTAPDEPELNAMLPSDVSTLAMIADAARSQDTYALDDEGVSEVDGMARRFTRRQLATLQKILNGNRMTCATITTVHRRNRMRGLS